MTNMYNNVNTRPYLVPDFTFVPPTFGDEVSQYEVLVKLTWYIRQVMDLIDKLGLWDWDGISADYLRTGRKIELVNEVIGSAIFNGSKDIQIDSIISPEFINELITDINNIINQKINELDLDNKLQLLENLINYKFSLIPEYELPIATATTLGGVKVVGGESKIGITEDGVLYLIEEEEPPQPYDCGMFFAVDENNPKLIKGLSELGQTIVEQTGVLNICNFMNGVYVNEINHYAFTPPPGVWSKINKLYVAKGIDSIGYRAFQRSHIDVIDVSNVKYFGFESFYARSRQNYENFEELAPPIEVLDLSSAVSIGSLAFGFWNKYGEDIGIQSVVFGEELEYIGNGAFQRSGLKGSLNLPHSLQRIGYGAFSENSITSIDLKSDVVVEKFAFDVSLGESFNLKMGDNVVVSSHFISDNYTNGINEITVGINLKVVNDIDFDIEEEVPSVFQKSKLQEFHTLYQSLGAGTYIYNGSNWVKQ